MADEKDVKTTEEAAGKEQQSSVSADEKKQGDKPEDEAKKSGMSAGRKVLGVLRYVAIAICAGIVIYEAYSIISSRADYQKAIDEYSSIEQEYVSFAGGMTGSGSGSGVFGEEDTQEEDTETYPDLVIDFDKLYEVNQDFIGWLYFPATGISYPMVKETRTDQYLRTTMQGTPLTAGTIFMDLWSNAKFGGMIDFIFGHNMRNKTMFGTIPDLEEDNSALIEDPYVYIYMKDRVYRYRAFSYMLTQKGSTVYTNVGADIEKYDMVTEYIEQNNLFENPMEYDLSSRPDLLILSTCSYFGGDSRFIVGTVKDHVWRTTPEGEVTAEERYEMLQDEYVTVNESTGSTDIEIEVDFEGLRTVNEDVTAWLYFPALNLSHPVLREETADEYVDNNIFGEKDEAGAIFTDKASDAAFFGKSDFIYGHYMRDGSMFGALNALTTEGNEHILDDNPYFYVVTEEGTIKYQAFSYYEAESGDVIYTIIGDSEDGYDRVLEFVKEENLYKGGTGIDFSERPGLLTLSTCSDFGDKDRVLLTGVRVSGGPEDQEEEEETKDEE